VRSNGRELGGLNVAVGASPDPQSTIQSFIVNFGFCDGRDYRL